MQDAFESVSDLKDMYLERMWSDVDEETKEKISVNIENELKAMELAIPSKKDMMTRAKMFYSSRRSEYLIKADEERRKIERKINHRNFVCSESI